VANLDPADIALKPAVVEPKAPPWCDLPASPDFITGLLVQALRQHFGSPETIEDQALRDHTSGGTYSSLIAVESADRWLPNLANHRPALIVSAGSWSPVRLGINDELMGHFNPDGSRQFETLWTGTHTVFCLHREEDRSACRRLGFEVASELHGFADALRSLAGLVRFGVAQVDQVHRFGGPGSGVVLPVTVAYAATRTVTVRRESPTVRELTITVADGP
jgi:hypothetical protein